MLTLTNGFMAPKTAFNGFGWGKASGLLGRKHKEGDAFFGQTLHIEKIKNRYLQALNQ